MRYVNQFKSATELANALLTETGVLVPAHRSDSGLWRRERVICIEHVGQMIFEETRRQVESMAMRDLCEAGRLMRSALQHEAAKMARELFAEWCEVAA